MAFTRLPGPGGKMFINLIEVKKEKWSFGNGIARYAV
jgi:hypothetical protein